MGLFSTRNGDGASGKGESANTISSKDWRKIQASHERHAPPVMSREATKQRLHTQAMEKATRRGEN
jgi:hypothetical protein